MYVAKKTDSQGMVQYTKVENETWRILFERQMKVIENRACSEFVRGLEILDMPTNRIPQCPEISERLQKTTGWAVAPVEKMIPVRTFFELLANKQFPAATFIRIREELDYLKEPDIFHEFFGHCPLLTSPAYASFMEWYGQMALSVDDSMHTMLGRLFWFTIEFGLVESREGLRIYGGGILSSFKETQFALESKEPKRSPLDVRQAMDTDYRYDEIQKQYFVLSKMDDLFKITETVPAILKQLTATEHGHFPEFVVC